MEKHLFSKSLINESNFHSHDMIIEDLKEIGELKKNVTNLCSSDIGSNLNTLLTNALRMSPSRIILGEIRSFEVLTFILAVQFWP